MKTTTHYELCYCDQPEDR